MSGEVEKRPRQKFFEIQISRQESAAIALPNEAYSGEVVQAKAGYSSLLRKDFAAKSYQHARSLQTGLNTMMGGILGSIVGVVGVMGIAVAASFGHWVQSPEFLIGCAADMVGVSALGAGVAPLASYRGAKRARTLFPAVLGAESENLRQWLSVRYGLTVSDEVVLDLVNTVYGQNGQSSYLFEDASGSALKFEADADGLWYVREQTDLAGSSHRAQVEASKKTFSLDGEVAMLHERIEHLLATLTLTEGSVERTHLIARARQDVGDTLSLLRRLQPFGGPDGQQAQRVVEIFSEVVDELNEAVEAEKAEISGALNVQRNYVIERRRAAVSKLELAKPGVTAGLAADHFESKEEVGS